MNANRFCALLEELIDENPFAIRAALKVLEVSFTESVPTLGVTCEERPRLLVNLEFVGKHCHSDEKVKAVICHEFLHVLLRHTEQNAPLTPARHLAFDAVINAIIHRACGERASAMMASYYADAKDLTKLLRPMNESESRWFARHSFPSHERLPQWAHAWHALYAGSLVVDDIEALATEFEKAAGAPGLPGSKSANTSGGSNPGPFKLSGGIPGEIGSFIGSHDTFGDALPVVLEEALSRALKEMNGAGIWRAPGTRGVGVNPYEALFNQNNEPMRIWRRRTLAVLRTHVMQDRHSPASSSVVNEYQIPVLSPSDRRAYVKSMWMPFLPDSIWQGEQAQRDGTTQVYLDVSGSMNAEMPHIIALLGGLSRHIRRPLWAFSNRVASAVIEGGQLKTTTSGGTSMSCVLEHIASTKPQAAVVVTDGYIERLDPNLVRRVATTRVHALLTRDGSAGELHRAGLAYTQLDKLPS
jgi:hypothetical protein